MNTFKKPSPKATKRFLATLLCSSLVLGTLGVNAVSISFDDIEQVEEVSNLSLDENILNLEQNDEISNLEDTETTSEELNNKENVTFDDFEPETEQENFAPIQEVDTINDFQQEIVELNQNTELESDNTCASKRLIVISDVSDFETYNAENILAYNDLYVLSYASENETKGAYDSLSKSNDIISVEVDSIVETNSLIETESIEEPKQLDNSESLKEPEPINDVKDKELIDNSDNTENTASTTVQEIDVVSDSPEPNNNLNGIKIAVIDSGINKNNPLFDGRIIDLGLNFSTSGDGIQDDNGHGTAVASIIAKNSDAYIMPIKIANSEGKGTVLGLYLAIQAAIENDVDIINLSMTTSSSELLSSIIKEANKAGIKVVASAGNESANVENYAPANIDSVITVASLNQDYKPASYSNYGEMIDYSAIGTDVEVNELQGLEVMSGTSLSTAYVSAVMAYAMENNENFDKYVYPVENEKEYYGNGIVSFVEVKIPEKEPVDVEGFDFKIKQSLIEENDRNNYQLEILTNENVEYTFDGGETWQKLNYIQINRNQEFYVSEEYMTSIRSLGIKDDAGNTLFKDFAVIDCNNPNDSTTLEINLEAASIQTVTGTTGAATYDSSVGANHDYVEFTYRIGNTSTSTANDSNTACITKYYGKGTGAVLDLTTYNTVKVKYNNKDFVLKVTEIGNGSGSIFVKNSGAVDKTSLKINANCTKINKRAFYSLNTITSVTFGGKETIIGYESFESCTSLTSTITIPKTVTEIDAYAFYNCSNLKTIKFAATSVCKQIKDYAFSKTQASFTCVPDSVELLAETAFDDWYEFFNKIKNEMDDKFYIGDAEETILSNEIKSLSVNSAQRVKITCDKNNTTKYVIYSNAVKNKKGQKYDLVFYPLNTMEVSVSKKAGICTTAIGSTVKMKLVVTEHNNINKPISVNTIFSLTDLDSSDGGGDRFVVPNTFRVINKGTSVVQTENKNDGTYMFRGTGAANTNVQIYYLSCVIGNIIIPNDGLIISFGCPDHARGAGLSLSDFLDFMQLNNDYTIQFNANGGSGSVPSTIIKSGTDSSVVMGDIGSSVPTKSGYTFKGWSASPNGTSRIAYSGVSGATTTSSSWSYATYCSYTGGDSSNKTLTLYAVWEYNPPTYSHTLAYNANGGTNAPSSSTTTNTSSTYSMTVTSSQPTRTGYTFAGWNTNSSGTGTNYSAGNSVSVGANSTVTLYAQWAINSSTLKVNPNGGSWNNSTATQSFTQNYNTTKSIPIPTKTGYTFTTWTKSGTNGSMSSLTNSATYTFGASNGVTDTLTAGWSVNNYTVTYIDVINSQSGRELGRSTASKPYNSTVRGSDKGSSTTDNAYYNGYYYVSDTSATVTTNGAAVYRIFKQRMDTIAGNIIWEDWNNKNLSRPESVNLYIKGSDGKTYSYVITGNHSQNTSVNSWPYSYDLPKYDSNGNVIVYTVSQDKAISQEEGLYYQEPIVNGYNITNKITNKPTDETEDLPAKVTITITWDDENDFYGFRPETATIELLQNGEVIKTADVSNSYTFTDLLKYDENGNKYVYDIQASDEKRYIKVENNSAPYNKTVTYTFVESSFSVLIPKVIVLDGNQGNADYDITVNGSFYYNDTLTVKPANSFTMTDRNNISSMKANILQSKQSFTKSDISSSGGKTTGSIQVDRTNFAGSWRGIFNFDIKFLMQN